VALAPRKKIPAGTHASIINLLLNWLIDGKLLIETGSAFQILVRLYLILLLRWHRMVFLSTLSSEEYRSTPTSADNDKLIKLMSPLSNYSGDVSPLSPGIAAIAYDQNSNRKQRWCKPVSPSTELSSNR